MSISEAVVYRYDGSFEGFLCCIFESYVSKQEPLNIVSIDVMQYTLYAEKVIQTQEENAERVYLSFAKKMSNQASDMIKLGFLTCVEDKELLLYQFIKLGYKYGKNIVNMLTNDIVDKLYKAIKHLNNEAHLLKGFVRFSENNGALISIIEPKNFVLPLIIQHFVERFPEERFFIYDKTHKAAIMYQPYEYSIMNVEDFDMPKEDSNEQLYQNLWKRFYDTIAIEARYNPKCRMSHMPKRYWGNMTEHKAR
jgi:probable DNA metabolism protein